MEIEIGKQKQDEWLKQFMLTKDQVKQLIHNKLTRAISSSKSLKQREMLCGDR